MNYAYTIRDKVSENEMVMKQIANNTAEQAMLGAQVNDAIRILNSLIPIIIDLMLDHPDLEFGETLYPVVG